MIVRDNPMRRIGGIIAAVCGLTLAVCLCGSAVAIFWDGYYLPNKPCRPVIYPDGQRTTTRFVYTGSDNLDTILSFYDQRLDVQPFPGETGQWIREKPADSKYLYVYECYAADINGITTETGCIYLSNDGANVRIEAELLRAEGGSNQCSR